MQGSFSSCVSLCPFIVLGRVAVAVAVSWLLANSLTKSLRQKHFPATVTHTHILMHACTCAHTHTRTTLQLHLFTWNRVFMFIWTGPFPMWLCLSVCAGLAFTIHKLLFSRSLSVSVTHCWNVWLCEPMYVCFFCEQTSSSILTDSWS